MAEQITPHAPSVASLPQPPGSPEHAHAQPAELSQGRVSPERTGRPAWPPPRSCRRGAITLSVVAVMALVAMAAGACGSSNTPGYQACKAMIKADLVKSLSALRSRQLPQNLPTAAAASCSQLSQADLVRAFRDAENELKNRSIPAAAASSPAAAASGLRLPAQLLGLRTNTSPQAQAVARAMPRTVATYRLDLRGLQAAVYGAYSQFRAPRGPSIGLYAGREWANTGWTQGFAQYPGGLRVHSFPAGPEGGALACGQGKFHGTAAFTCEWADKVTGGGVYYYGGAASSLSDAASKTNQIRALIEP